MIVLPRYRYDDLVDHAINAENREVCGILGGNFSRDRSTVESVYRTRNAAEDQRSRYAIDPAEQLEILDRLDTVGEAVVGFYHSHPTGPSGPSEIDATRATWPDRSYVIISLDGHPYVGSWRWRDGNGFEPEPVTLSG